MKDSVLTFASGSLKLEGVLHLPLAGKSKVPAVIICHPHSLHGGDMHNNVVVALCHALTEKGIAAMRFNFRGVGASEGNFDEGKGEQDDLKFAGATLAARKEIDAARLGLAGYSFGGMVALAAAKDWEQVNCIAAVSPVVSPGVMEGLSLPGYFICGTRDHVVSTELLCSEAAKIKPPGTVELINGVDHFWAGREGEMAGKVANFMAGVLC